MGTRGFCLWVTLHDLDDGETMNGARVILSGTRGRTSLSFSASSAAEA